MLTGYERVDGLRANVGGEHEERDRDHLLCAALGTLRSQTPSGEQPEDDEAREALDQRVRSEADQGDGAGRYSGTERDPELDEVPGDPAPSQETRLPFEVRPFLRGYRAFDAPDLEQLSHAPTPRDRRVVELHRGGDECGRHRASSRRCAPAW